jgi:hypothetical protein
MFRRSKVAEKTPEELLAIELQLDIRRHELLDQIAGVELEAGEAALDAVLDSKPQRSVSAAAERVAAIRAEVEATQSAIAGIRAQRVEALAALNRAEAAGMKQRAAELRAEAEAIDEAVKPHLAAVAELQKLAIDGTLLISYFDPRSQQLRRQAREIERQAATVEARQPRTAGVLEGTGAAEVLVALFDNPEIIGPTAEIVEAWIAETERVIGANEPGYMAADPEQPRVYGIEHGGGKIPHGRSRVVCGGPAYGHAYSELGRVHE